MKGFFVFGISSVLAASLSAATEIPSEVAACTNFITCAQGVRNKAVATLQAAGKAGDLATIAKLLDAFAKDGRVTVQTYPLWSTAAGQFADLAANSRKRGAPKELLAGFREGGATFGLWSDDSALKKTGGDKVVEAIEGVLYRKMPQAGLSPDLERRRDIEFLDRMVKVGGEKDRQTAYARLEARALACAKPQTAVETNGVVELYRKCLGFHADRKLWADYAACADRLAAKTVLSGAWGATAFRARRMAASVHIGDEGTFGPYQAELAKRPLSPKNLTEAGVYVGTVVGSNPWGWRDAASWTRVESVLAPYWTAKDLSAFSESDRAYVVLSSLAREMARRDYAAAKPLYEKFAAFDGAVQRNARLSVFGWAFGERAYMAELAVEAGEYAEADALLAPLFNVRSPMQYGWPMLTARYLAGNRAGAFELAAQLATNGNVKAQDRFRVGVIVACLESKDMKEFADRVAALRGEMTEAEYFDALRASALELFRLDPTAAGRERVAAVVRLSDALKRPEERLAYDLVYLADAPRSAGEALAGNVFAKLKTENRLGRYAVYDTFEKSKELKLLKGAEAPHLAADVEGREACVAACYDASGVHVYLKFNDPEAWKVRDGLSVGPNFEYEIQPGGETTGHWQMLDAVHPMNDAGAVWDSPRKGFKVGADHIRTDAVSTDACHVFHTFVPWVLCWNEFPKDGDVWRYGLVAGWAGQFGALGGGSVHELGRALSLRFRIAPTVRERMKLSLVRQAVGEYRKVRDKFENAEFWCDPHLGDAAFYGKVVKPLVDELDAKAALVVGEKPEAKDVEAVFRDLFRFADFRLALDAERESWVMQGLFRPEAW